ncbi:S1 RNA-binding domain-containing protein [Allorhizocola rhizosphaerae]|uniref:S1 RNA-binding domain-containing protein n=1 Tax=Allorhizocola rhizosphaerae TaxID=1872709 RepID=UPI000E3DEC55|nr:S1 RNA-binding domain-containing protein [Allorhizocola rhizosphaerae]
MSNPDWQNFLDQHDVGDVLRGRVTRVVPFGAFVEVAPGIGGLVVGKGRVEVGAEIAVRIAQFDPVEQWTHFTFA